MTAVRPEARLVADAVCEESYRAAERNAHKGDYLEYPIKNLFAKLEEECYELYEACLLNDPQRIREEMGDVARVAGMIGRRCDAIGERGRIERETRSKSL